MLKILGKSSSINVRKVLWLCEEAAISYEQQDYGSGFISTQTAQFKALNPNGLVPVIVDDGFVLWESNTICRYLAGRERRDDLLPVAPRQRALVEKWMDWQATELNNAWRYAFMGLVRKSPAYSEQPAIAASIAGWNAHMGILEAQLAATGAYAAGETFTLADIVLGLSVNRWKMSPIDRPAYPAIDKYYALLNQRPAFQRYGNNGEP
ncbi:MULTISPECIES: glutathione S-transferase family protein [Gibbsiella]|uniref:Glutathione S-transferase n=1 Tax=Gibbsiella dentisursi TaxID=796890 RepID=A0ABP7KWD3_9GAMM|nr:glutathione S-transferase [Gibbsiella quercinecans]